MERWRLKAIPSSLVGVSNDRSYGEQEMPHAVHEPLAYTSPIFYTVGPTMCQPLWGLSGCPSPASSASNISFARSTACNFKSTLEMLLLTVLGLRPSRSAISAFV